MHIENIEKQALLRVKSKCTWNVVQNQVQKNVQKCGFLLNTEFILEWDLR